MSKVLIEEQTLYDIGNAVRERNGLGITYKPSEMAGAISLLASRKPNLNLVINGNFVHPINTRHNSSYSGSVTTINGWTNSSSNGVVGVTPEGLRCSSTAASNGYCNLYTVLHVGSDNSTDDYLGIVNSTLTLSAIVNGEFKSTTFVYKADGTMTGNYIDFSSNDTDQVAARVGVNHDSSNALAVFAQSRILSTSTCFIASAIKLEFGNESTLFFENDQETGMPIPTLDENQWEFDSVFGRYIITSGW